MPGSSNKLTYTPGTDNQMRRRVHGGLATDIATKGLVLPYVFLHHAFVPASAVQQAAENLEWEEGMSHFCGKKAEVRTSKLFFSPPPPFAKGEKTQYLQE